LILTCLLAIAAYVCYKSIILVQEGEVVLVERFGKFNRMLTSGLHQLTPLYEAPRNVCWNYSEEDPVDHRVKRHQETGYRIGVRERIFDSLPVKIISKDKLQVSVNPVVFFQVVDPKKAVYNVTDLLQSIEQTIGTSLREALAGMTFDAIIDDKERLSKVLYEKFVEQHERWGITITRVEIQEIKTTDTVMRATEQMVATQRSAEADIAKERALTDSELLKAQRIQKVALLQAQSEQKNALLAAESQQKVLALEIESNQRQKRAEIETQMFSDKTAADARAYAIVAEGEAYAKRRKLEAEADQAYFNQLRSAGASEQYLTQRLFADAWKTLATNANKGTVIIPLESARFLGSSLAGGALNLLSQSEERKEERKKDV